MDAGPGSFPDLEDSMRNPRLKKLLNFRNRKSSAWSRTGEKGYRYTKPFERHIKASERREDKWGAIEAEVLSEDSFADISEPYSFYREDNQVLEVTRHDGAVCCQLFTV